MPLPTAKEAREMVAESLAKKKVAAMDSIETKMRNAFRAEMFEVICGVYDLRSSDAADIADRLRKLGYNVTYNYRSSSALDDDSGYTFRINW